MKTQVADTATFLHLARNAKKHGFNRQIDVKRIEQAIDPEGIHVVALSLLHNDNEIRTQWMVKLKNGTPGASVIDGLSYADLFLDVAFEDFNALATMEVGR